MESKGSNFHRSTLPKKTGLERVERWTTVTEKHLKKKRGASPKVASGGRGPSKEVGKKRQASGKGFLP